MADTITTDPVLAAAGAPMTPEQQIELRKQYARMGMLNAGLSAGLTAGQFALAAAKTDQDRENRAKLEGQWGRDVKAGRLATTAQTRAADQQYQMGTARAGAMAAEGAQKANAALAARGGSMSAADQTRIQREAGRASREENIAAGAQRLAANLVEADRQQQEYNARLAYESERKKQIRQSAAQALGAMAGVVGQVAGAHAVQKVNWGNMDVKDQLATIDAFSGRTPAAPVNAFIQGAPKGS